MAYRQMAGYTKGNLAQGIIAKQQAPGCRRATAQSIAGAAQDTGRLGFFGFLGWNVRRICMNEHSLSAGNAYNTLTNKRALVRSAIAVTLSWVSPTVILMSPCGAALPVPPHVPPGGNTSRKENITCVHHCLHH